LYDNISSDSKLEDKSMDARRIGRLVGDLRRFLRLFDDCFARSEGREHLQRYVHGQLSNVRRKCAEPMADALGMAPRTLQDFLATHTWDHQRALDRLQQWVAEAHLYEEAIGLIDETSFPKRGDKTAGVQRQYCGATGKIDNCVVTVGLGYADLRGQFRCTLDHQLFLPESWDADRNRCREAHIPDEMPHQPKWRIALDMLQRAQANGIRFAWLTFDEGYGCNAQFLETLHRMGQTYVAEVPKSFTGWLVEPMVLQKAHHSGKGRPQRFPRLAAQSARPNRVDRLCTYSYVMRDQPWQDFHVKDGHKGPIVWQAKAARFRMNVRPEDAGKSFTLPSAPMWLIVAQHPMTGEIKYFVSNASAATSLERILHVAFSRWHIERCFQDEKGLLGLDHFECRRYRAIQRHLILTMISHLFLARTRLKLIEEGHVAGGKMSDAPAASPGHQCVDSSARLDTICTTRPADA
jgi:SRSO17 transposase